MTFKVGDRVRIYSGDMALSYQSRDAKVIGLRPDIGGLLEVEYGPNFTGYAHPKQCRRLVKKPAREYWITASPCFGETYVRPYDPARKPVTDMAWEVLHVREVRKKKSK